MPLDGHAYLVSQGWQGHGSGLRHGAIHRPVIVTQKKTLAGIGKDRDEAFPFWDHVFTAAVNAVKIKVYNSDSEDTDTDESNPGVTFQRTRTGIISNRRPVVGTPASHSGTATPSSIEASGSGSSTPRMSIMAAAKQEAARRTLYSMFFRGPILGTDIIEEMAKVEIKEDGVARDSKTDVEAEVEAAEKDEKKGKKRKRAEVVAAEESAEARKGKSKKSSRKGKEVAVGFEEAGVDDSTALDAVGGSSKKSKKRKDRNDDEAAHEDEQQAAIAKAEKAERKRLRAEKRALKEEKRKRREENAAARALQELDERQDPKPTPSTDGPGEVAPPQEKKRDKKDRDKSKKKRKLQP